MREITPSELESICGAGLFYDLGHAVGTAVAKLVDALPDKLPTTSRSVL